MGTLRDESRELREQIGCMNGILQLFDRHHLHPGRRMGGHRHKRLLQGTQQHQLEPTKNEDRLGISTESSRASFTSSSCSSTLSPLDVNRSVQLRPEPKPKNSLSILVLTKDPQPLDLRALVKDSMHREPRGLSIKTRAPKDEMNRTAMKHVDSPRPPSQTKPKTPNPAIFHEIAMISMDERMAIGFPRFSCDGRESGRGAARGPKQNELPRLSLDSKASAMKAGPANEQGQRAENKNLGHSRSSSIVAKLMGIENFPGPAASEYPMTPTKACPKDSHRLPQNDPATSPSLRTLVKIPIEPPPWSQQDSRGAPKIPKMANEKRRVVPPNNRNPPSVYGDIEKRITELQFQKSGKDLRALKQILEAMQKTRDHLEEDFKSSSVHIIKPAEVQIPVSNRQDIGTRNTKNKIFPPGRKIDSGASELNGASVGTIEPHPHMTQPDTSSPDTIRVRKNVPEQGHRNRKYKGKAKDVPSSGARLCELRCKGTRDKENFVSTASEGKCVVEPVETISEQPSPISVLEDTFYGEDSPSPVKKKSTVFQSIAHMHTRESENSNDPVGEVVTLTQSHLEVEDADHAEQIHQSLQLNHKHINKILLSSSKLLKEPREHVLSKRLINPNMFHLLKQAECIRQNNDGMKIEKKMNFDVVDQVLVRKIAFGGLVASENKMTSPHADEWTCYESEAPNLVLQVERLIFKDLINDVVVGGEGECAARHCRKLFVK